MNHIITDFINKQIDSRIESLRGEIAELKKIADDYGKRCARLEIQCKYSGKI